MQDSLVTIRGLVKRFGPVRAVDGLDLDVARGEIFGLLGPNGAGKTTVLRALAGLLRPSAGTVRLFGLDPLRRHPEAAARAGFLIEGPGLHPNLSARRNLLLFGRLRGLAGAGLRHAVSEALDYAGLNEAAERPVSTYSTGMQRKTAVAHALLGPPELAVLDEPTSALDPAAVVETRDAVMRLHREKGVTFLLSSHHLAEMETLCTRVAVIRAGRVLATGSPRDLLPPGPVRYRIAVADAGHAAGVLQGRPGLAGLERAGDGVEADLDPADVPEVVRTLVEAGASVRGVRPARSPLEEAFLRLTVAQAEATPPAPGEGGAS